MIAVVDRVAALLRAAGLTLCPWQRDLLERQLAARRATGPAVTVFDQYWRPVGRLDNNLADPADLTQQQVTLQIEGTSPLIQEMINCDRKLVPVTIVDDSHTHSFYVTEFQAHYDHGKWSYTAVLLPVACK